LDDRGTVAGLRASFLRCGLQGLDLFERADGDVHGGEEMNHLALNVDAADVELFVVGLSEAGINAFEVTPDLVFICDPDGHRIEMLPISASEGDHERESARATGQWRTQGSSRCLRPGGLVAAPASAGWIFRRLMEALTRAGCPGTRVSHGLDPSTSL
jgi:hypothetical protein